MNIALPSYIVIEEEIKDALSKNRAVVALESSVFCQGLPIDDASNTQEEIEWEVREHGAVAATIGVVDGQIVVGINRDKRLKLLEKRTKKELKKLSERDLATAVALKESGGTTVSATLKIAHTVGISVFATGGIGGVHRSFAGMDISSDLLSLSQHPVIVISAGIKSILNVRQTLEALEALRVPVMSYRTPLFPNFYCSSSGIKSPCIIENIEDIVNIYKTRQFLKHKEAILLAQALADEYTIEESYFEAVLKEALVDTEYQGICEQNVTPFLLSYLADKTNNATVRANVMLLKANARLGARVAACFSTHLKPDH